MIRGSFRRSLYTIAVAAGAVVSLVPARAHALQPLSEFLGSARSQNLETREAKAAVAQREAEADQAWGRLVPAISARASYTRNEFEATVSLPGGDPIVITPKDQLEASFTLEVPLVDVSSWSRIGAARAATKAAAARADATALDAERAIAQRYLQAVAGRGLTDAAEKAVEAAKASRVVAQARRDAGATGTLEVDRADAEIARAEQSLADAKQVEAIARRALQSLSGLAPAAGAPLLTDDLKDEGALDSWEKQATETPAVRASILEREVASKQVTAAWTALVPVIAASANERITNATGFAGQNSSYTLGLTATWRLDFGTVRQIGVQQAAENAASARTDRTVRDAKDRVFESHQQVTTQIAKSKAARAQVKAAANAASVARDRYASGAGTQLDVIQADRDAFQAEVARIQADSDLVFARLALRIAAGKPLTGVALTAGGAHTTGKATSTAAGADEGAANKAASDKASPDEAPSDKAPSDKAPSDKAPAPAPGGGGR